MGEEFKGKRALVTGAGRGIGKATAVALAKLGAHVIAVSKTEANLKSLASEVPGIQTVCLDVSNWKETERVVKSLLPIHYLVNNAGVLTLQPIGEIKEEIYDEVFNVNVKAVVNISQIVACGLKNAGVSGAIVNVSSQAAKVAIQDHAVYCASKGALDQITRCMALELGPHNIRVNSINPTVVETDMGKMAVNHLGDHDTVVKKIPLGKFCTSEDVADSIIFLLSDKASMITGATLLIDGGYTIQ